MSGFRFRVAQARSTVPAMVAWGDVPTWLAVAGGTVGGFAALRQLSMQREQLRDQQEVITGQARLLERQQASQVRVSPGKISGAETAVLPANSVLLVHMAVVANDSGRPIRNVVCRITPEGQASRLAAVCGELMNWQIASGAAGQVLGRMDRRDHWRLVPAGLRCAFVFPFDVEAYPKVETETRFADDAGVDWEIDHDLRLVKLLQREEW